VARFKIKPGMESKMNAQMKEFEGLNIDGYMGTSVYKMDTNPYEFYMVVAFRDKDAYFKNADDPAQDARYRQMLEYVDGEPEWHDGEVIYSGPWTNM
jgi:quinol monooxygenase YgiN